MSERFCVKMRASDKGSHISGAERIVAKEELPRTMATLAERALNHSKGSPDMINIKLERTEGMLELDALPVSTETVSTAEEGWELVGRLLKEEGFERAEEIKARFKETYEMRGAMLLDADTLERLEPDQGRGVRATYMDREEMDWDGGRKDHFREALVLATKVSAAPGIVGEICMSDDPDYVTGYIATKRLGYKRITVLKESGDAAGGRIFLYRGDRDKVQDTIDFLERQAVLVRNVPAAKRENAWDGIKAELEELREKSLERKCRTIGKGMKVFSANDYLGLAAEMGGSTGSRLVTGTSEYHVELERLLAEFKGSEAARLYATGYMANVGTITALAGKDDVIFSDELNHASIIDGARLSGAKIVVYKHLDMADLEEKIRHHYGRRRLAVSDGVFSMDGDMLNLPEFLAVCKRHGAISMVDEAHANGVIGQTGRGLKEHFGCEAAEVTVGTLSKAFGAEGGFVTGSKLLCDYLANRSRAFIFSTAMSVESVKTAIRAVKTLMAHPEKVEELRSKVKLLCAELKARGIEAKTDSAIVPIMIGDEAEAVRMSEELRAKGFEVGAIRYPSVAKGKARLRIAVSAAHTEEALKELARVI